MLINFDRVADIYDATRGFPAGAEAGIAAFIAEKAELKRTDTLLEVGIGTGRVAVPLSAHVDCIIGIDISRNMMQKLREKSATNRIDLFEGDVAKLPFADNSIDVCLSVHVFHLIPDMASCMQEINRVLKPDGVILYAGGPFGDAFPDLRAIWNKHAPIFPGTRNPEQLIDLMKKHGWQIPDSEFQHPVVFQRRPGDMLNGLKVRGNSQTWRMSDEQIAAAIEEMEAGLEANYPEPDKPVDINGTFNLGVYHRA